MDNKPNFIRSEDKRQLGEVLVSKGLISNDQLQVAYRVQKDSDNKTISTILIELGFITEQTLYEIESNLSGKRKFNPNNTNLESELINLVPKDVAIKHKAFPVSFERERLTVAITDVYNIMALDQIKRYFPKNTKIEAIYASENQVNDVIERYYNNQDTDIDIIIKEIESGKIVEKNNNNEEYVSPTVRLVEAILKDSIKKRASDIHLEPDSDFIRVRYRIDGNMIQVQSFHKEYWQSVLVRIKILSDMNIAETRLPQDGRIVFEFHGRKVDFRVATQPTIHGENVVLRILDKKSSIVNLDDLGITPFNLTIIKKALQRPEGVFIVTGPTGSGKTTTLYSILNYINSVQKNIMTLEDPVEYNLPMIRQSNIREGSGLTFTDGIKAIMRQDPDIIFVGEIRDEETANMSIRAAMTGHQVFTTLHTNDALGTIVRLIDIGIDPRILSGAVNCIVAQRLVRKLCNSCKEPKQADEKECKLLNVPYAHGDSPIIYFHKGCNKCNFTGYKGRIPVNEVVYVDTGLDEMIATRATKNQMYEYVLLNDFLSIADDASHRVISGITDTEEIIANINMISRM